MFVSSVEVSIFFFFVWNVTRKIMQVARTRIRAFTLHCAGKLKTRETCSHPANEAGGRLWARPPVLSPVPQQARTTAPPITVRNCRTSEFVNAAISLMSPVSAKRTRATSVGLSASSSSQSVLYCRGSPSTCLHAHPDVQ